MNWSPARAAFEGDTASDVIAEILKSEPAPPSEFAPEVPYEIERIIGTALRKDRESRYQSVASYCLDLQDFQKEAEFQAKLQAPIRGERDKTASDRDNASAGGPVSFGCGWFVAT